jgi:hypothetical protein
LVSSKLLNLREKVFGNNEKKTMLTKNRMNADVETVLCVVVVGASAA